MEITRTARAEDFEIRLQGRLDAAWCDHVARALAETIRAGQHNIVLDMAAVDYLSSAGIRILVLYSRQLTNIQGRLGVVNPSGIVRNILALAGLDDLLSDVSMPSAAPGPAGDLVAHVDLPEPGATAELYALTPEATLRVQLLGDAGASLAGRRQPEACTLVQFPADVLGIGLGGLVSGEASLTQPLGEFLAAAGAAVCQPADGSNQPDYLLLQGALRPAIKVAYGLTGSGGFRGLLRFDKGPEQASLPLSTVVKACLDSSGGDLAGIVMIAETASLIGASLQKAPSPPPLPGREQDIFAFPEVRDWLGFTAEPAFASSTSLVVGFAARPPRGADLALLRPMTSTGGLYGHFHAAALPYHPLRKGRVNLAETLRPLFENEQVLGVLHLLNDWRGVTGVGESQFLRGACWFAPATL
jgi:anti-anti-sigma factor